MSLAYRLFWRPVVAWQALKSRSMKKARTGFGEFEVLDRRALVQFSRFFDSEVGKAIRKGRGLFVDVGANVGLYTVMAASRGREVVALEPAKDTFAVLKRNLVRNLLERRVEPVRAAAWSSFARLRLKPDSQAALRSIGDEGEPVAGVPLDFLLEGRRPVQVKIDVEGRSGEVLKGAVSTLDRARPQVVFEARSKREMSSCLSILKPLGYRVRYMDGRNWSASPS